MPVAARHLCVYGAGGFGREVAWLAQTCNQGSWRYEVVCFIDDDASLHGQSINDIPVLGLAEAQKLYPDASVVGGVGEPRMRAVLMGKVAQAGLSFATLIHPRVEHSAWIEIGPGTVICAGNILTTNIKLGQHVQINLSCTIGHDVIMDDYATLAPGVHVSGCVHIGKRVYVGTGAVIINGTAQAPLVIEDDVIVGAGACVIRSVPAGLTVVGVPAKPLSHP
jgi:sugar O-acyltransferase (sialic acid O-acetyltransferase NeuD family)